MLCFGDFIQLIFSNFSILAGWIVGEMLTPLDNICTFWYLLKKLIHH